MCRSLRGVFARYVSLNMLGMLGLSCYILADTFFVARALGETGLAALNLAIPVYGLINGSGLMIGTGGAIRFSVSRGWECYQQALWLAVLLSGIFLCLGGVAAPGLARALGAGENTQEMVCTYIRVLLCFSPAFLINNVWIAFIRNDGAPGLAMAGMLTGSMSNIVLDYLFMFPLGMGIFGAALATGMAPLISMGVLSRHFQKGKNTFHLVRRPPSPAKWLDIVRLGLPALVGELSSGVTIAVFNLLILPLAGEQGVAAYGVVANLALVALALFNGISQGMQPLVSRFYGHGHPERGTRVLGWGCLTALVLGASLCLGVQMWAEPVAALFSRGKDAGMIALAAQGMRIYFIAFLPAGINVLVSGYLSAVERAGTGFAVSILRGIAVMIPMALLLSRWLGMNGIWAAVPVTEFLVLAAAAILLNRCEKDIKRGQISFENR